MLHTRFTLRAPLIVSARRQRVLHHRVANYQPNVVGQRQQTGIRVSDSRATSAFCACPNNETNWSMMPTRAPTNSFSARWHKQRELASIDLQIRIRDECTRCRDFDRRGRAQSRSNRHFATNLAIARRANDNPRVRARPRRRPDNHSSGHAREILDRRDRPRLLR